MRVNSLQIGAYAREISRASAETGKAVDVRTGQLETVSPPPADAPKALPEVGSIPGVLTPEESRWIADLFRTQDGNVVAKVGTAYTHAGRTIGAPANRGTRLDLRG